MIILYHILVYMRNYHVLKVAFLKFGVKSVVPRKKLASSFYTPWSLG